MVTKGSRVASLLSNHLTLTPLLHDYKHSLMILLLPSYASSFTLYMLGVLFCTLVFPLTAFVDSGFIFLPLVSTWLVYFLHCVFIFSVNIYLALGVLPSGAVPLKYPVEVVCGR